MMAVNKICELLDEHGITAYTLEKEAGLAKNVVRKWIRHEATPSLASLQKVAGYFHIKVSELIEDNV